MNPNTPRPGHLFFTPRTPWGTRAGQQSFRQHQRASEDKKPDPTSTSPQIPASQKAPADPRTAAADRDIVRQPGNPAPSVKEQLQREIDWNRQQGYTSDRDLTLQQKHDRDNLMRDTFQPKPAQPEADAGKPKWGVSGELSYGRARPKDGPTEFFVKAGVTYGIPAVQDQSENEEEKKKKISPNGTGEE